jgi:hypothetical protein
MSPVDSGQLFLLAGIFIIAYLWLLGCSPGDRLLKINHVLRREYPKRRDEHLGGKQVCEELVPIG